MSKAFYSALMLALLAITALTFAVPAEAGRGNKHGYKQGYKHGYKGGYKRGHKGRSNRYIQNNYYGRRGNSGVDALGAGLIGFGVGAVVGSALTPREVYVAPPPPRPVYRAGYNLEPWSPDWYSYCYSRYRSFNPDSGTFIGYDGYERFCR